LKKAESIGPRSPSRKPNALARNPETESSLVPTGIYVLVKRFSSKEERRRVVACVLDPRGLPAGPVGIENHLNYYHLDGRGMSPDLARGLCAFLNSSLVDVYFRQFSGHTQVNATDLRSLRYPDRKALERLGKRVKGPSMNQEQLDEALMETCFDG
jgi:adenine-specific DNA-methyltransferase